MNVRKSLTRSLSNQSICTYISNTQIVMGPKPTLTFQSKTNIYFPGFKVAMGPISRTFAKGIPLEQDVCL